MLKKLMTLVLLAYALIYVNGAFATVTLCDDGKTKSCDDIKKESLDLNDTNGKHCCCTTTIFSKGFNTVCMSYTAV